MADQAGGKKGGKREIGDLEERVRFLELQAREAEAKLRTQNAKAELSRRRGSKSSSDDE